MRFSSTLHRLSVPLAALFLVTASLSFAQKKAQANVPGPQYPPAPKAPALIDPAGPSVSLTDSEALFDIAVALNACGYDNGLEQSDPLRAQVRQQVNQAIDQSAEARNDRDQLCTFINQHRLAENGLNLAQYVSLALYVTPPPALEPSVDETDMPPDSTQVEDILPILRRFAQDIDLHVIWVTDRAAYDAEIVHLHDPLTKMIVDTNFYLKMPAGTYSDRRFLVVVDPLLSPGQTNARIYGSNYVVVISPDNKGAIHMSEVRHVYLHYEIEPLIYARSEAIDRFQPFLNIVREAPLAYRYREDIVSLVVECMIRAIEARTMSTGVDLKPIPAGIDRSNLENAYRAHNLALAQDAAIRQKSVDGSMTQGFVLTQYFYSQLIAFEKSPASLKESIGEMVYGMDVPQELNRVKHIEFADQSTPDVVQQVPPRPSGLDLAEIDVEKGDAKNATALAQAALQQHDPDPARANFILARADLMNGKMEDAQTAFQQSVQLGHDARLLAWSHIYLGRILDVEQQRDQAVAEYKQALAVRDGQPDTKEAAESGMKKPFTLPGEPQQSNDNDSGKGNDAPSQPPSAAPPQ
ncbi:MAG: tetratricopeptide repeat protein [Silvibacterium sp.]